jgi:adenylate cyclase
VGDGVNTTSRLQTLNKEFGTTILISEATYQEVKDLVVCREMPASELRGKAGSVRLYEVVSLKAEGPQAAA